MTVEALRGWGADTREGLARCMNNEALYLRLVGMLAEEAQFAKMRQAVAEGKLQEAFEAAHALKGVLANLALTPLYTPVSEITEMLRAKTETDYGPLLDETDARLRALQALIRGQEGPGGEAE